MRYCLLVLFFTSYSCNADEQAATPRPASPMTVADGAVAAEDENPCDLGRVARGFDSGSGTMGLQALLWRCPDALEMHGSDGLTLLQAAAKRGRPSAVEYLLALGADINARAADGTTALHWAHAERAGGYCCDCRGAAAALIKAGADVDATDSHGATPLHWAARWQRVAVLLANGADTNKKANDGTTPLAWSMKDERPSRLIFEQLVKAGADVNVTDDGGRTALFWAAAAGELDLTRLLLDRGCDPNHRAEDGPTALHWAMEAKRFYRHEAAAPLSYEPDPIGTIDALIAAGADLTASDAQGRRPIHWAAEHSNVEVVLHLLDLGAEVDAPDDRSAKPIHYAARSGNTEIVEQLIARKANVTEPDAGGRTCLHWTAERGGVECAEFLLAHGLEKDQRDSGGIRPLHLAAAAGNLEVADVLLEHGASVNAQDDAGRTPLHYASESGMLDSALFLLQSGASVNVSDKTGMRPLHLAANGGHIDTVDLLLSQGADAEVVDSLGRSALALAYENSAHDVVARLASEATVKSSIPNAREYLREGRSWVIAQADELAAARSGDLDADLRDKGTALCEAAASGNTLVGEVLLDRGAFINATTAWGTNALQAAVGNNHTAFVKLLLSRGADRKATSRDGSTLLSLAAQNGHYAVMEHLRSTGLDVNTKDKNGATALGWAARRGSYFISKALINRGAEVDPSSGGMGRPLANAAYFGNVALVKLFLENGAEPYLPDEKWSPTSRAVSQGHRRVVEVLTSAGDADQLTDAACSAAVFERPGILGRLIKRGVGVNRPCHRFGTVFIRGLRSGDPDVIDLLLQYGADVNVRGDRGETPLMIAAGRGDARSVELLLERGAQVGAEDDRGNTALHNAARSQDVETIKTLLHAGADASALNKKGKTPLLRLLEFSSSQKRRLEVIALLLEAEDRSKWTNTHRHELMSGGVRWRWPEAIELMLDSGLSIDDVREGSLFFVSQSGAPHTIKLLLENGYDVCRDKDAMAIHKIAEQCDVESARLMLAAGASVNAKDKYHGGMPLHSALRQNARHLLDCKAFVEFLIENGADVNAQNQGGRTPLHRAAATMTPWFVKRLIKAGADVNAVDKHGRTPFMSAVQTGSLLNAELILAAGGKAQFQPLADDASAPARRARARPLLHEAILLDRDIVVDYLLEKGAKVDLADQEGNTPLHVAAGVPNAFNQDSRDSRHASARALLSRGARLDAKNNEGNAPMHLAALHGEIEMARLFLSQGADANARNDMGRTPLHLIVSQQRPTSPGGIIFLDKYGTSYHLRMLEMLQLLLEGGADISAVDKDGLSPVDLAGRQLQKDKSH